MNRNVLISQMKERVEAAFAAQEESNEVEAAAAISSPPSTPPTPPTPKEEILPLAPAPPPPPANHEDAKPSVLPSSEESSNDASEAQGMKIKNTILRHCFASLHRRQKKEKEQEYHQYLNGFD